jgi:tRNA1(Val) A37 N6-methylase TrmN6
VSVDTSGPQAPADTPAVDRPGPVLVPSRPPEPEAAWPEDANPDPLVGDWRLWQRRGGHRTSTDDLLTAWLAVELATGERPRRYLDLGCGIGSVLLMTAHALRPTLSVGVEAQAQSVAMARRSVAELPDAPDIVVTHGDLRDARADQLGGVFDLVTGSPPYLPPGTGVMSPDAQRAACRFELRGGVEEYCLAAARCLAPEGRFALVFQTIWSERVEAAGRAAGLSLVARADVRTRVDRPEPFLSVFGFALERGPLRTYEFSVRAADGAITPEYRAVRAKLGLS